MLRRTPRSPRTRRARALAAGGGLAVLLGAAALLAGAVPASASPSPRGHAAPRVYYLALGDSLAQGVQPATPPLPPGDTLGQSIETNQGYANDIYAHYAPEFRGRLTLEKLGCPGETTTSMLTGAGSPCTYPQGSQLASAVAFIRAHRGETRLITIDIGANDVDGCVTGGVISETCVATGIGTIEHNLPLILGALRRAAGPSTPIVGMNLYDPFLAAYLTGAAGQATARDSAALSEKINQILAASDQAAGARTADVQDAFSTTDFTRTATLPGIGTVPLNVARICTWTWMCAPPPVGPNIHANAAGYAVIAAAFERVIGFRIRPGRAPAFPHFLLLSAGRRAPATFPSVAACADACAVRYVRAHGTLRLPRRTGCPRRRLRRTAAAPRGHARTAGGRGRLRGDAHVRAPPGTRRHPRAPRTGQGTPRRVRRGGGRQALRGRPLPSPGPARDTAACP